MKVYGLSQVNQHAVEEFDKHTDVLVMMKELLADPLKYKKLTDQAMQAVALVEEEKKRRNEAVELIEHSKQLQKDLRKQIVELDEKKVAFDKYQKDSLDKIVAEQGSSVAVLNDKKKSLDERDKQHIDLDKKRQDFHVNRTSELDAREKKVKEDETRVDSKKREADALMAEIEALKAKLK